MSDHPSEPSVSPTLERFIANFGEQAKGITEVVLPLGHPDAIKRLARDLIAFGYGMGESPACSASQLEWFEKAEATRKRMENHVEALAFHRAAESSPASSSGLSSLVPRAFMIVTKDGEPVALRTIEAAGKTDIAALNALPGRDKPFRLDTLVSLEDVTSCISALESEVASLTASRDALQETLDHIRESRGDQFGGSWSKP